MTSPWIIDTWVNLLSPLAPGQNPEGEQIFARYGMLDLVRRGTRPEELIAEMDAAQVAVGGLCGQDLGWVAETCARYPDRAALTRCAPARTARRTLRLAR